MKERCYVKSESNDDQDKEIREVGVDGTKNIIESVGKNTKVIFPSTHVVYEGFSETAFDLTEDVETCPVLTYSKGKVQSEEYFENSSVNYVVLRLGSVYGYGGDSMRLNIMPNLFYKMVHNQTIKLFGGGVQWKSLVSLFDVARCMKFMAEQDDIKRQIFHLRNENMTVKDVADICKIHKNDLEIIETDDEIPNKGYTLSNQKLLDVGFEFQNNINDDIKEMIDSWTDTPFSRDVLEYKFDGGKEFVDDRGRITNYELPQPIIGLVGLSLKRNGEANHWHPIQQQKCILISGRYISVFQDLKTPNYPMTTQLMVVM